MKDTAVARGNSKHLRKTPVGRTSDATVASARADGTTEIQIKRSKTLNQLLPEIQKHTGTHTDEIAFRIIEQIAILLLPATPRDTEETLSEAIRMIAELEPQNATEAMLATQFIATHEAAVKFLRLATLEGQTTEGSDANVNRAARLMRLHLDQIEALQKLKGRTGQQKVVVEHVHVYPGGQAIVGVIGEETKPRGGGS